MRLLGVRVHLRDWSHEDVDAVESWLGPGHRWQELDAPYFPRPTEVERCAYLTQLHREVDTSTQATPRHRLVVADAATDAMLGQVTWYWESAATDWRRLGIVLYDPKTWNGGRGSEALLLWTQYLFDTTAVRRLDLATWSGNEGMLRVAARLGFREEGRFREARVVDGIPFDAVVMGVLRSEWEAAAH